MTAWNRARLKKFIVAQLVKKLPAFMEPEGSSPYLQEFASTRPCATFRDVLLFCGEGLLAPAQLRSWRTTPYRLSASPHSVYWHLPSTPHFPTATWGYVMQCWQGT